MITHSYMQMHQKWTWTKEYADAESEGDVVIVVS